MFIFPRVWCQGQFVNAGSLGSWWICECFRLDDWVNILQRLSSTIYEALTLLDPLYSWLSPVYYTLDLFKWEWCNSPLNVEQLQPLKRSFFGSLKKYINAAGDAWATNYPDETMRIYGILHSLIPLLQTFPTD